jgi:hypothetical protein
MKGAVVMKRRTTILFGLTALGLAEPAAARARELPSGIRSAYICTKFGLHGDSPRQSLEVKLSGKRGRFDPDDPLALDAYGRLDDVRYAFDESTIYGTWRAGGESGWFRWAFYDDTGFYGSWGSGRVVAENERGYWNGEICNPQ